MVIKHTAEFDISYRFITETNQNIFLTGKAGTGKTTFLKYVRADTLKECVVAAPTGVAAINARGVTLHSLFQLPFGIIIPSSGNTFNKESIKRHPLLSKLRYSTEKLDLLRNLDLLIIDEASMVASYIVDAIDTILRYVRKSPHRPFGGVQVLFVGDLYQLPPVVKREDWEILREFYSSIFFFDSFVLRENPPVIIELKEIFRQTDAGFIEILNGIRNNNISKEKFGILQSRLISNFVPKDQEEYITLTTHNQQADEINRVKLADIHNEVHRYRAEVIDDFPENAFPAEKELELKIGAQVMFLRNDIEDRKYFNGKIGTVTELNPDTIKVRCKDDIREIEVKKSEWENIRYRLDPVTREITEEVLGSFIQYPLRLAWAITIHKSQGLTFEKVVIDSQRAFAKGQVYVALSRCTSLDGLVLKTPVGRNFLGGHSDFIKWENDNLNKSLPQRFAESRQNYMLEELKDIFTWTSWYFALIEMKEFFEANRDKVNEDSLKWLSGLMVKQTELYEVSEKFKQIILRLHQQELPVEKNNDLQKRLKEGSVYFYSEILAWRERFIDHPIAVETKKVSTVIDGHLIFINQLLEDVLDKIGYCRGGFVLDEYLHNTYHSVKRIKNIRSSYIVKKRNTVDETIRLFRELKNTELIAAERGLTTDTIEGHLAKGVRQGLIKIDELLPSEEVEEIAGYFPRDLTNIRLRAIKDNAPPEVSFGQLKIVLALLEKRAAEADILEI